MAYDSAREWLGHDAGCGLLALDRGRTSTAWPSSPATRSGAPAASGSPPTTSATSSGREYEALREDGFAAEWRDELPAPLAGRFPARALPSGRRGAPAGAARCGGSRSQRRRRAPRSASTTASRTLDELEAETVVVATDGYPSGLLGELEGLIIPTRGQMIATEPLPERLFRDAALRPPRLRLLAPERRRPARSSAASATPTSTPSSPPRRRRRERIQEALDGFAEALLGRRADGDAPLGRHLRARPRPPAGRRAGTRRATASGSPAATRARQRARPRCAASSSRRRSRASRTRCSSCSSPARLVA